MSASVALSSNEQASSSLDDSLDFGQIFPNPFKMQTRIAQRRNNPVCFDSRFHNFVNPQTKPMRGTILSVFENGKKPMR
jgi:hypothetical protein